MADIEVYAAEIENDRVRALKVRFKGTGERTIDRDTALAWILGGHSLITHAGSPHHPVRGHAIERVEVGDEAFLRTDVKLEAADHLAFPGAGRH
ncbi:MAG: hypothetical protein FJ090_06670 [Deltaproteobacteria bacterium]|nr:hypothetical protein [Deltaproteobacteria bacterium]